MKPFKKSKVMKGLSLVCTGVFVYALSACSVAKSEQQTDSVSQDEQQL